MKNQTNYSTSSIRKLQISLTFLILSNAALAAPPKTPPSSFVAIIVKFEPGSFTLTNAMKEQINKKLENNQIKSSTSEVIINAWSDKSLPKRDQALLESDRDLAIRRAQAISGHLGYKAGLDKYTIYNMAENLSWIAHTLSETEANIKSIFARTSDIAPISKEDFVVIKENGGPSKAVVLIRNK